MLQSSLNVLCFRKLGKNNTGTFWNSTSTHTSTIRLSTIRLCITLQNTEILESWLWSRPPAMAVVVVAEALDGIDDSRSTVSQLGVCAAATAGKGACCISGIVVVRRRGGLLHPGGHAGGETEECCTAAGGVVVLRWKGGAAPALHIYEEEIWDKGKT